MRDSIVESAPERGRVLNAVALQNAVLCAECDVVSDSPHDHVPGLRQPIAVSTYPACLGETFRNSVRA